jgi:hypothetical protein
MEDPLGYMEYARKAARLNAEERAQTFFLMLFVIGVLAAAFLAMRA